MPAQSPAAVAGWRRRREERGLAGSGYFVRISLSALVMNNLYSWP
jgi:hypothetical protein